MDRWILGRFLRGAITNWRHANLYILLFSLYISWSWTRVEIPISFLGLILAGIIISNMSLAFGLSLMIGTAGLGPNFTRDSLL